jgi:hypothetical protein
MHFIVFSLKDREYFISPSNFVHFESIKYGALDTFDEWKEVANAPPCRIMADVKYDGIWYECVIVQAMFDMPENLMDQVLHDIRYMVTQKKKNIDSVLVLVRRARGEKRQPLKPLKVSHLIV